MVEQAHALPADAEPASGELQTPVAEQAVVVPQPVAAPWICRLQTCRTFYPSIEEFRDPTGYIASIHDCVAPCGMAKIVPPAPPASVGIDAFRGAKVPLSQQLVCTVPAQNWDTRQSQPCNSRTAAAFVKHADSVSNRVFKTALPVASQIVEVRFDTRVQRRSDRVWCSATACDFKYLRPVLGRCHATVLDQRVGSENVEEHSKL